MTLAISFLLQAKYNSVIIIPDETKGLQTSFTQFGLTEHVLHCQRLFQNMLPIFFSLYFPLLFYLTYSQK